MSLLINQTFANTEDQLYIPVYGIQPGNGITVDNTDPEKPIIQNDGLFTASGGPGIAVSGGQDIEISNTGVLTVNEGAGIDITGDAQNPTITNTGILSVSGGTSITIGGTVQAPIVNNPDFFRRNYTNSRSITQGVTSEIVLFTENFVLPANTTFIHTFSFNNFPISATPGTPTYYVISRILPQGVGYPGLVSNLIIQNSNAVWSDGRTTTFTTTNATSYTFELRVNVGTGTLNLRNVNTNLYRVS